MIKILDVNISEMEMDESIRFISLLIRNKWKNYICFAPASSLVKAYEDDSYKRVLNDSELVFPDGMSVVMAGRMMGSKLNRICGVDFMETFIDKTLNKNFRHFFFGNNSYTLSEKFIEKYPILNICGYIIPNERQEGQIEKQAVINEINSCKPDIVWVGLGSPKQDIWMANHIHLLNAPILIGVGAAFDYLSGYKERAPLWMRNYGLEWLYRLYKEPKRLWRRYLIGNFKFIYYLLKDWR